MRRKFFAQGNNGWLWWCWNSQLTELLWSHLFWTIENRKESNVPVYSSMCHHTQVPPDNGPHTTGYHLFYNSTQTNSWWQVWAMVGTTRYGQIYKREIQYHWVVIKHASYCWSIEAATVHLWIILSLETIVLKVLFYINETRHYIMFCQS